MGRMRIGCGLMSWKDILKEDEDYSPLERVRQRIERIDNWLRSDENTLNEDDAQTLRYLIARAGRTNDLEDTRRYYNAILQLIRDTGVDINNIGRNPNIRLGQENRGFREELRRVARRRQPRNPFRLRRRALPGQNPRQRPREIIPDTDETKKAKEMLNEIINEIPWITLEGDRVIMKPPWLKTTFANAKTRPMNLQPWTGINDIGGKPNMGRIRSFEFNMNDVGSRLCIKFTRQIWRSDLRTPENPNGRWWVNTADTCLSPRLRNQATGENVHIGDAYATVMMHIENEEQWKALW